MNKEIRKHVRHFLIDSLHVPEFIVRYCEKLYMAIHLLLYMITGKTIRLGQGSRFKYGGVQALGSLLKDLDAISISEVFLFLHRSNSNYLIERSKVFTSEESELTNLYKQRIVEEKYIGIDEYYPEVFLFHNGLAFLKDRALKYIENKDVIDAGAYVGDSAVVFSKKYSFNKIYSFEPVNRTYLRLLDTIRLNECDNALAIEAGLGGYEKNAKIDVRKGYDAIVQEETGENIKITTIDSFVKNNNSTVGFIKMDIEGLEYEAVEGARHTIATQSPILSISLYHNSRDFFEIKPLIEEISSDLYEYVVRKLNPTNLYYELVLIAIPKKIGGRVSLHPSIIRQK